MAPLPVVPSVIRTALVFSYSGDTDVITRFFLKYTGTPPTNGELDSYAVAIGDYWGDFLKPYSTSIVSLETVEMVDLTSDTSAQGTATVGVAGTNGDEILPADVAVVASYEIGRRYRGGHPRGYWPAGGSADLLNAQQWTTTFQGDFLTALGSFFSDVVGAGWSGSGSITQVNASLFEGFTVEISPSTGRARNVPTKRASALVDPITTVVVQQRVGSQRRRLGRS